MLRTSLCDYSDAFILVNGTKKNTGAGYNDAVRLLDEKNKGVMLKNCVTFTANECEIKNTQIATAKYIGGVMSIYNLIEYSYRSSL